MNLTFACPSGRLNTVSIGDLVYKLVYQEVFELVYERAYERVHYIVYELESLHKQVGMRHVRAMIES